jgi:hypothetical protein
MSAANHLICAPAFSPSHRVCAELQTEGKQAGLLINNTFTHVTLAVALLSLPLRLSHCAVASRNKPTIAIVAPAAYLHPRDVIRLHAPLRAFPLEHCATTANTLRRLETRRPATHDSFAQRVQQKIRLWRQEQDNRTPSVNAH